jgi:2-methylaconitate cis-trans-isomerase PrpF
MQAGQYYDYEQMPIRCSLVRGGSSKGAFFLEHDLPPAGPSRDAVLKRAMGTPDVMQIDGLGGTHLITSKIAIVGHSSRPDADIDFTFAQAEIARDIIDYTANCGNISAGVGPFAIDAGLVRPVEPVTQVRIHNTNTGNILIAHVPVFKGRARVKGDTAIAGVPGTGAGIYMDYKLTLGAKTGKIFPTGNAIDKISLEAGGTIDGTICDVASTTVFVRARDLGMRGDELPNEIEANRPLIDRLQEIRGKAAEAIKFTSSWRKAEEEAPFLPFLVIVSPAKDYKSISGAPVKSSDMDFNTRFIFMNKCHTAMAGTGSMCIAAASRIPGSVVNELVAGEKSRKDTLSIGHPSGVMHVRVMAREADNDAGVGFDTLGFERTARKIMDGVVYVPVSDTY